MSIRSLAGVLPPLGITPAQVRQILVDTAPMSGRSAYSTPSLADGRGASIPAAALHLEQAYQCSRQAIQSTSVTP